MSKKKTVNVNYTRLMLDLQNAEGHPNPIDRQLANQNPYILAVYKLFDNRKKIATQINSGKLDHDVQADAVCTFVQYNKDIINILGLTSNDIT